MVRKAFGYSVIYRSSLPTAWSVSDRLTNEQYWKHMPQQKHFHAGKTFNLTQPATLHSTYIEIKALLAFSLWQKWVDDMEWAGKIGRKTAIIACFSLPTVLYFVFDKETSCVWRAFRFTSVHVLWRALCRLQLLKVSSWQRHSPSRFALNWFYCMQAKPLHFNILSLVARTRSTSYGI